MKPTTVDFLLKTLREMEGHIEASDVRIRALEMALQKCEPNLYQSYQASVEQMNQAIKQSEQTQGEPVSTQVLRAMLLQDQG